MTKAEYLEIHEKAAEAVLLRKTALKLFMHYKKEMEKAEIALKNSEEYERKTGMAAHEALSYLDRIEE